MREEEEQRDPVSLCEPGAASHSSQSANCRVCVGTPVLRLCAWDAHSHRFPKTYRLDFRFIWHRL